jgi:hypothetical protein
MPPGLHVVTGRPNWLTAGTRHMLVLIAAIVAVEMIPVRLTVERAWWLFGLGLVVPIVLGALLGLRRHAAGVRLLGSSVRLTDAVLVRARHIGLPLIGLAFFAFWTLLYTGLWAANPDEAFGGVGERPRLADFFYYAVSTAFTSPPEGIVAGSRGVRSATMIELFTALALISVYLSSFVDWQRTRARDENPEADHGRR